MVAVRKPADTLMTVEDFFDWPGDGTDTRYQLVHGEPRAMAPASPTHALIQTAVARLIENHLVAQGSPCRTATEAPVVPRLNADVNLRVPDVAVTCGQDLPDRKVFPDPVLVVEILSPGNERDTRDNLWSYASILSMREILFVHSTRVGAELHRRQSDGNWPEMPERLGSADEVVLESIGFRCRLADFYARTHLAQSA